MLNTEALQRLKATLTDLPPGVVFDQSEYLTESDIPGEPVGMGLAALVYLNECWAKDADRVACITDMNKYGFDPHAAADALGYKAAGLLPPIFRRREATKEQAIRAVGRLIKDPHCDPFGD